MNEVTFHLDAFDGPLDLLLHLISKNKVEITDIPIAEIATLCGYTSPSYFVSEYKRHFGETPLHRRKNKSLK